MQNLKNPSSDLLLNKNFGRPNNETSHYSDSDSWDTDFEDEGIENADVYGDADTQKKNFDKTRNQYNVASLTRTIAASLQVGSNSYCSGNDQQRPKNEAREVSQRAAPAVPDRPPTVSAAALAAAAATLRNKTVSSLPKPPCQASEHVRQVIGNLGQFWSPEKPASQKQQNDNDYEPIHSGSETPNSSTPKVPPETQKSFLHSSMSLSSGTSPSTSSTAGASSATPTRRAPPRPAVPPSVPSVPFVHGAGAANALNRLAAAAEASKQQLSARTSKTLPVETKEKCIDDKRAATLPTALLPPPPPSTSPLPPLVSNRPLPPTPAGAASGASSTTSSPTSSSTTSSGANRANALSSRPWFHDVDRRRAEELVRNGVDGYFLVRPSSQSANALTLTMWYNHRVYNISIRLRPDGRIALGTAKPNEQSFATVEEMVANYQSENLVLFSGGKRTGLTVLTTYPPHKN